jgi:U11/U12 small nuclear ribonucleoprotein SNRNP65
MDTFVYFIYYRFDIRLMKEGRMKGQGFPTEEAAEKALNDTNGYVLNGKSMSVVSFLVNVKQWVISYGC